MQKTFKFFAMLLSVILGAFAAPPTYAQPAIPMLELQQQNSANLSRQIPTSQPQMQLSFAPVVKEVAPAVVNIYAKRTVQVRQGVGLLGDPLFNRFFAQRGFSFGVPVEQVQNSLGSGVIINADGTLVTNAHVIDKATDITVVLSDRREFPATVVSADPRTDIALLKIQVGDPLPYLQFGDSEAAQVGDLVLAVGNPFGVGQTVTSGIISALARTTVGISDYRFFIQTDAAINPGNSGGALVDMAGRLIGINTAIYSRDGGSNGIGFAIPIEMVQSVVANVDHSGRVVRPWLGASGQSVTSDLAASLGLPRPAGVLINDVSKDSPAARGGLKVGDVVLTVNKREVDDAEALRFRVATLKLGDSADFHVIRNGRPLNLQVPLEAAPESTPRAVTLLQDGLLAGAEVANLSPALADEIGMDANAQGVVILSVAGNSTAMRLSLRPGDIILSINGKAISTVTELATASRQQASQWNLKVRRGQGTLNINVQG